MRKLGLLVAVMLVSITAVVAIPPKAVEGEAPHEGIYFMETGKGGAQARSFDEDGKRMHYVIKDADQGVRNSDRWGEHGGKKILNFG